MKDILKSWQTKMFLLMWITYASFYLCRVNLSVALPGMLEQFSLSKTDMGIVFTALFAMYSLGQFINGQLGDKIKPRFLISIGLLSSAVLNVLFGFTGGVVGLMVVVWGLNGYFQSMGWAPTVKTMANWFPPKTRGRVSGKLGTSYIIGGALSWVLAGFIASMFSWQYVFFIPALICAIIAINWYINSRNSPVDVGLPAIEDGSSSARLGFKDTIKLVLTKPHIWYTALALFGLNIVRYGFMSWAPTYMFEMEGISISNAAYKAVAFPVAGGLGALFAGWLSDKECGRAKVAMYMLLGLAAACVGYLFLSTSGWLVSLILLLIIGFLTFGPHILIVAAMPADFGTKEAASSVTGFVDGVGYIGASLTGVGTGLLVDWVGWNGGFIFWISGAIFSAIMMMLVMREKCNVRFN